MPDFAYTALTDSGTKSSGSITAATEREAASMLDARGLFPLQITEAKASSRGGGIFGGVGGRQLATFYSQLADLIQSGVPLLRSLELLEKQTPSQKLSSVLRDVRLRVADGTGMAQAMGAHPKVFNDLVVSMVRAGQEGGFLEDVLQRTAGFVEHQEDMKTKVIGAMAYPAFLLVAGMGVLLLLVTLFVPRFEPVFEKLRAKGKLPMLTEGLINFSNFLLSPWGVLTGIAMIVGFISLITWSRGSGRETAERIRLQLPIFGSIFKNLALSRFTRILGTMLHNGIPILKALHIAKDSTGNVVLTQAIEQATENITAGRNSPTHCGNRNTFPAKS